MQKIRVSVIAKASPGLDDPASHWMMSLSAPAEKNCPSSPLSSEYIAPLWPVYSADLEMSIDSKGRKKPRLQPEIAAN
jgi:hypothetical protein